MPDASTRPKRLIEGRAALIVIDIQANTFDAGGGDGSIPCMDGYAERMLAARDAIDTARAAQIPVVFIQEVHRPDHIDFGRELDGAETAHCIEGAPGTEIAVAEMGFVESDHLIRKRRYSAFFGTDFEILLKGLKAETLILVGGLTDVCVHYTFVDAHQHDYHCRVIEDCVAGSSFEAHNASLNAMEYLQTGARCSLAAAVKAMSAA